MAEGKTSSSTQIYTVPHGAFETIPSDYKIYDDILLDQTLAAASLSDLSPLKGSPYATKTEAIEWKSLGEKKGCVMSYAAVPGSDNHMFRGVCDIPIPPKLLEDAMRVPENLKLIDPMCLMTKDVHIFDDFHRVLTATFKMPWPVYPRDFVWYNVDYVLADGTYVTTGKSCTHKDAPEVSGNVRGEIRATGYVVQAIPGKPDMCHMTYVVQVDPKGWLPTTVVNYAAAEQAFIPGAIASRAAEFLEADKAGKLPKYSTRKAASAPTA